MKICLARTYNSVQVEFPADLPHPKGRRGGRGTSLHLARNVYRDVTQEELDFLREKHPAIFAALKVVETVPKGISKRTRRKLEAAVKAANQVKSDAAKAKKAPKRKRK